MDQFWVCHVPQSIIQINFSIKISCLLWRQIACDGSATFDRIKPYANGQFAKMKVSFDDKTMDAMVLVRNVNKVR